MFWIKKKSSSIDGNKNIDMIVMFTVYISKYFFLKRREMDILLKRILSGNVKIKNGMFLFKNII